MNRRRGILRTPTVVAALLLAAYLAGDVRGEETNPYAELSDEAFSELVSDWQYLGESERRWLLIELHRRNAANESRIEIPISGQSRFGRPAEAPDDPAAWTPEVNAIGPVPVKGATRDYGDGFERRSQESEERRAAPRNTRAREAKSDDNRSPRRF